MERSWALVFNQLFLSLFFVQCSFFVCFLGFVLFCFLALYFLEEEFQTEAGEFSRRSIPEFIFRSAQVELGHLCLQTFFFLMFPE